MLRQTKEDRKWHGWPPGRPKPISKLRGLFPADRLKSDLQRLGLSPSAAAKRGDVAPDAVLAWLRNERAPYSRTLRRFLEANGIDRDPYRAFLVDPVVTVVCPCGRSRRLKRAALRVAGERAKDRSKLKHLGGDVYERPCRACSARKVGRHVVARLNRRRLKETVGRAILELAEQGNENELALVNERMLSLAATKEQLERNWNKFRAMVRRPKSLSHREAIGRGRILRTDLRRRFALCPLCELAIYGLRWHRDCWYAWLRWCMRNLRRRPSPSMLPPPSRTFGPKPEVNLARNYRWLMARRSGEAPRGVLASMPGSAVADRTAVTKGVQAMLRVLPGCWDLVFANPRKGNAARQHLVPLPVELHALIERGERDDVIRRLIDFGMAEDAVARVTGATVYRVRGIAQPTTTSAG